MAPFSTTPATAIERPIVITSFSSEDDLDKVWAEIIIRVNKITKWDLNDKKTVSIDQVLAKINPPKDGKPGIQDKAKVVFKNALICVQRFGQFAANAASMVFGPASQCMNAISFVITAIQDYDAVFGNITALMERVSVFMERLRIYLDDTNAEVKLDKRLRLTVYRVLDHFLTILGLAHKLTHGWKGKLKLAVEIGAFGKDEGVKDAMAKLETLVADVTSTEITVIVKDLSEAARNIRGVDRKLDQIVDASEKTVASLGHLETAEQRRTADEEEKKRLGEIREALNIDATKRHWTERQDELWGKHIPGTGKWLLEKKYFPKWADTTEFNIPNILSLKAEEGYGKSYLCSIVVSHLHEIHRDDTRVGVAYYYFQRDRDVQEKNPINRAMKAIIYQLASAPTALGKDYAKLIQKACVNKNEFGRTSDLWKRLVTDAAKNLDATFFIVFDGIDETEGEPGRPLAAIMKEILAPDEATQLKIRLFFTGRPEGLDSFADVDPMIPEIRILPPGDSASLNEEDILLYAEEKLGAMDIFKDDSDEVADLKERAKTELGEGVRGDYFALDYKLDSLSKSRNVREVEEILSLAKESRTEAIAREVDALNDTLTEGEVREVNLLLSWEAVCFGDLNVDVYEQYLLLKAETRSLISLEKQMRDRYAALFDIGEESKTVTIRSDDIRGYLQEKDEMINSRDNGKPETTFQEGEVSMVRRILKNHFRTVFGDDEVYDKYSFETFFESKLGDQALKVRLMSDNENHVRAAQACLIAICDHFEEADYSALHTYAWEWFADHVNRVDINEVSVQMKQDIGRKLVRVLREEALIDVWWNEDRLHLRDFWVYKTFITNSVYNWLKDPVVQKGLLDMPSERSWVIATTSEDGPGVRILSTTAKRLAEHWFEQKVEVWYQSFLWLHGYLANLREEEPDTSDDPTVEQIGQIEEWGKETLANAAEEAKWHLCLANTLYTVEHWSEAVTRYRQAIELLPEKWNLKVSLAHALSNDNAMKEAVQTLEDLIASNQELLESDEAFKTEYWETMLHSIGNWNIELKEFEKAEATYKKVLDEGFRKDSFEDFVKRAVFFLTLALNEQEKYKETIDLLSQLELRIDPDAGTWLIALFHIYAGHDPLHDRIISAAHHTEQVSVVVEKYNKAIEVAHKDDSKIGIYLHLRYFVALLLWSHNTREEREAALDMWEEDITMELPIGTEDDYLVGWARSASAPKLAIAFLDSAKEVGLSTPLNPEAEKYAMRLEKLTQGDPEVVREYHKNTQVCLARLYHLAGDDARAKSILKEFLKTGFQLGQEEETFKDGMYRVCVTLQAMDDDVNAVAAWCLFAPTVEEDEAEAAEVAGSEDDDDEDGDEDDDAEDTEADGQEEEQAEAGAEQEADDAAETKPDESDETKEGDAAEADAEEDEDEAELSGILGSHCDGGCGVEWTYVDNVYSCKDCLDVQFEPNCYAKLQAGTLGPKVCSKNHSHILLPSFDKEKWESTPKEMMWVAGEMVAKEEWIQKIKKEWAIDDESLKARERFVSSAKKIQRAWRLFKPMVKS